jgi:hypothetical protein
MAKIIPNKDMPFIYTSYLPGKELAIKRNFPLAEFDNGREEIIKRIKNAPKKHADNLVVELRNHTVHLLMHARVLSAVRNE